VKASVYRVRTHAAPRIDKNQSCMLARQGGMEKNISIYAAVMSLGKSA
jgi:hypothetical protein